MICCARCIASCALLRCSSTTASAASLVAERDFDVLLELLRAGGCASSSVSTFFCASMAPIELVGRRVELAAADVVARGQQRRPGPAAACTAVSAFILTICCSASASSDFACSSANCWSAGSNSNTTSPVLTGGAGRHQLDEAQRAARRRRDERRRPAGAQLAGRVDRELQRAARRPARSAPSAPRSGRRRHRRSASVRADADDRDARRRSRAAPRASSLSSGSDPARAGGSRACRPAFTPARDRDLLAAAPRRSRSAVSSNIDAVEPVDDRTAVVLEDRFGGREQHVGQRDRWRCARSPSCRAGSADRAPSSTRPRSKFSGRRPARAESRPSRAPRSDRRAP